MSEVHHRLKETLKEFRHAEKVKRHYAELEERLSRESAELRKLEQLVAKEEKDVKDLERASVKSLFYRILGDRDKQLQKERQEYLQVALSYNDMRKSVELIEYEIGLLEGKLDRLEVLREEIATLKSRREEELLAENSSRGIRLRELCNEVDARIVLLQDIDEATDAGRYALDLLSKLEKQLREARNWGQWDMWADGAGWLKHSAIDKARGFLHKVRHALIRFNDELSDVFDDARFNVDLRIERIDNFMDIFFDNLITDWVVQQKIKNALDSAKNTRYQVNAALRRLSHERPNVEREINELEAERESIILDQ